MLIMRLLKPLCMAAMLAAACGAAAADTLRVKFRSRALLDATATGYGKDGVQGYYRLEDFRVGFKANYGRYELKADIGLGGGKVAVKDLQLNYHVNGGVLSVAAHLQYGNGNPPGRVADSEGTPVFFHGENEAALCILPDGRYGQAGAIGGAGKNQFGLCCAGPESGGIFRKYCSDLKRSAFGILNSCAHSRFGE